MTKTFLKLFLNLKKIIKMFLKYPQIINIKSVSIKLEKQLFFSFNLKTIYLVQKVDKKR